MHRDVLFLFLFLSLYLYLCSRVEGLLSFFLTYVMATLSLRALVRPFLTK